MLTRYPWKKSLSLVLILGSILLVASIIPSSRSVMPDSLNQQSKKQDVDIAVLEKTVIPKEGIVLPVVWKNYGEKLVTAGVIDATKLMSIYQANDLIDDSYYKLISDENNGNLKITQDNASYLLNLLWALGLANKNPILETGEIANPKYDGIDRFASTGGWTLSQSDPMDYYNKFEFIKLTADQQKIVDRMAQGIYRPCCNNSTHFPDCNHGMAMLGLLELMASQGMTEEAMWQTALIVNSYWFPDSYLTIANYFENQGIAWSEIDPKVVLGKEYSSGSGYQQLLKKTMPIQLDKNVSCGVN